MRWLEQFKSGFKKTSQKLGSSFKRLVGRSKVDQETLDLINDALIMADLGPSTANELTEKTRKYFKGHAFDLDMLRSFLHDSLLDILKKQEHGMPSLSDQKPHVFFISGINGSGKTTSIGKISHYYTTLDGQKKSNLFVPCDTFRSAATEQLSIWSDRNYGEIYTPTQPTKDPSGLAFGAMKHAIEQAFDHVFIDTAGRLHNRKDLMENLQKIHRVSEKSLGRPLDTHILVLDANGGQNLLQQVLLFKEYVPVDGIILTKCDGTAKAGVIINIVKTLGLPIYAVGLGEQLDDLKPFDPDAFVQALLDGL